MSSARKGNYAPKRDAGDSFEELSAKLTADLRNHVRFMVCRCVLDEPGVLWERPTDQWRRVRALTDQADYPVLSDDWITMAEQIGRIGDITEMVRADGHTPDFSCPTLT